MSIISETGYFNGTQVHDTLCCTSGQGEQPMEMAPMPVRNWLDVLTSCTEFFGPCKRCSPEHTGRDNRVTYFDIVDSTALCSSCKDSKQGHKCLQVRRSSYHEVVKVSDISRLVDISMIQPYVINGEKVVFLRQRPQPRPPKGCVYPSKCGLCSRHLMDGPSSYCSLRCKLEFEEKGLGGSVRHEVPKWGGRGKRTAASAVVSVENPSADNSSYSFEDFGHLQSDLTGPALRPLSTQRIAMKRSFRGTHRRKSYPRRAPFQ